MWLGQASAAAFSAASVFSMPRRLCAARSTMPMTAGELTRSQCMDVCLMMLVAGLDTVTSTIGNMFHLLCLHPHLRERIVADPDVIPHAVEEMLRISAPIFQTPRVATVDIDIACCPVRAGERMVVNFSVLNWDPERFPEPDTIDFDRQGNRHVSFGVGKHRCLGSHLARRELRVALREWHRRIPEYSIKPGHEKLVYPPGLRSVKDLTLVWPRSARRSSRI